MEKEKVEKRTVAELVAELLNNKINFEVKFHSSTMEVTATNKPFVVGALCGENSIDPPTNVSGDIIEWMF